MYINDNFDVSICEVEELCATNNSKSFKIIVNFEVLGSFMLADNWPEGILIRRYNLTLNEKVELKQKVSGAFLGLPRREAAVHP